MRKYLSLIFLVVGFGILTSVLYVNSAVSKQRRTFSPYTLLTSSWENYKIRFVNPDGRVIDYDQGGITTSEGQSYALLQAVWMDDKTTFDKVWQWTQQNLQRETDMLFGWRWGQLTNGAYGLLPDGGQNAASDADVDIALALLLASSRWQQQSYAETALPIITDVWKMETDIANGKRYMIAGNWATGSEEIIINPSYIAPYAWRIFAKVDPNHDWLGLIDPAYELLHAVSINNLDTGKSVGLPPDWVAIKKADGSVSAASHLGLRSAYGFDAMRVPWRIAIDYVWSHDGKAKTYLDSLSFLASAYEARGMLPSGFTHDGADLNSTENPVMYATSLGYFMVSQPDMSQRIYNSKILELYSNDTNSFRNDLPYYEENWLWFGAALYLQYVVPFSLL